MNEKPYQTHKYITMNDSYASSWKSLHYNEIADYHACKRENSMN